MLSEIMASQRLTPSPPSPLPVGEGRRGEGKEFMGQPLLSWRPWLACWPGRKGFLPAHSSGSFNSPHQGNDAYSCVAAGKIAPATADIL